MEHQLNPAQPPIDPDNPAFRAAVEDVLEVRLNEVLTRIRTRLENAGYADAARYVTRHSGD